MNNSQKITISSSGDILKKIQLLDKNIFSVSTDTSFYKFKTPTTVAELNNIVKGVIKDFDSKYSIILGLTIGAMIVIGIAIIGWVIDSFYLSHTYREGLNEKINNMEIQINSLKESNNSVDEKYDYINNKLDNILYKKKF